MTRVKSINAVFLLTFGFTLFHLQNTAYAVPCEAITGRWAWFTGGNVTLNPDGTVTSQEFGNLGTWECADTARGAFTLRWIFGNPPFVDTLTLSADGQSLSGTNQFQYPVTAKRIGSSDRVGGSFNPKAVSLRFFESGYNLPSREKRIYVNRFDKSKTRYVYWELELEFSAPGSRRNLVIEQLWYRPDGALLVNQQTTGIAIEADWTRLYYSHSYGWRDTGNWPEGSYRVDLYVVGQKVASGTFEIYGASSTESYFALGLGYYKKGMYDEAIAEFTKAIELNLQLSAAYNNRGSAYSAKRLYDQAISDYTKAIELDPKYAEAYTNRATAYKEKGQFDKAIEDYTTLIKLKPDDVYCYNKRASAYRTNGQYDLAVSDYTRVLEVYPEDEFAWFDRGDTYMKNGDYDKAIFDYTIVLGMVPEDEEALLSRAEAYVKNGQYDEADKDASKLIYKEGKSVFEADAYNLRGMARVGKAELGKGKHEWALSDYSKAIELSPKFAEAYNNRGNVHYKLNQKGKALNDFIKAKDLGFKVEKEPLGELIKLRSEAKIPSWEVSEAMLHFDAGMEHSYGIGPKDKAIAEFTKAIELNPKYAEAYLQRGIAYHAKGQQSESLSDFDTFSELDPKDGKLYSKRAGFYRNQKKYGEAVNDYSKAIEYDPEYTENYYGRGNIYIKVGRYEPAILDFTKLIELSPKDTGAYESRASAYMKTKQYNKALSDYSKIIEQYPDRGEAYFNRAAAYKTMGDNDKAAQDLKKASDLGFKTKD
ncbi:MAG: tetratricopeptide repeat protein [Candidatus Scalindua sp.]|nr:tetratricopeptide repeat protein [Candidatus Scalindua sp.]